jgi:hypothetical protein
MIGIFQSVLYSPPIGREASASRLAEASPKIAAANFPNV